MLSAARRRALCSFATPALRNAVQAAKSTTVDLRTQGEIDSIAGPSGSLHWDFRNDPSLPTHGLPEDKHEPIILF